jgi:hypothetical protein
MKTKTLHTLVWWSIVLIAVGVVLEEWSTIRALIAEQRLPNLHEIGMLMLIVGLVAEIPLERAISKRETEEAIVAALKAEQVRTQGELNRQELELTDQALLLEQRLTANYRWRFERIEKAVLPRSLDSRHRHIAVERLRGLGAINVATLTELESLMFGGQIKALLEEAGVFGKMIALPMGSRHYGTMMYSTDANGGKAAKALWETLGICGGTAGMLPLGTEGVPPQENCILVGVNDGALQPGAGQPGEGLDEHGRPIPQPR